MLECDCAAMMHAARKLHRCMKRGQSHVFMCADLMGLIEDPEVQRRKQALREQHHFAT